MDCRDKSAFENSSGFTKYVDLQCLLFLNDPFDTNP